MTLRGLVASGLVAAAAMTPVLADSGKASVRISTEVVRSCRVTTDQPEVSVDCGTRTQSVQVSYAGATPVERAVADQVPVPPASATTVTIHF
jgi:hypothetical protein